MVLRGEGGRVPLTVAGTAAAPLATSVLPARRASGVPILEAAKAE